MNAKVGPQPRTIAFRLPVVAAAICAFILLGLIAAGDWFGGRRINLVALCTIPVLLAAASTSRKLLWAVVTTALFISIGMFVLFPPEPIPTVSYGMRLFNRGIFCAQLVLVAAILHAFVGTYRRLGEGREALHKRHEALEAANAELAAREEEITTQNEELQSQTEELERQSEQLRVTNDELSRREKMLEILLSLSRALRADLPREEALEKICRTLGQVINEHDHAAAILLRESDGLRIKCHFNFGPRGPVEEVIPYPNSFASLVVERNRTGFLEDVSLRPELHLAQPHGQQKFQSVIATPLRVNGSPIGTLEAYSLDKRPWSDEQIAMIESLAAQTSVSLQSAELYERVEQERKRLQAVLETVPFSVAIANADLSDIRFNPAGAMVRRVPPNLNINTVHDQLPVKLFHNGNPVSDDDHPLKRAVRYGEVITNREYDLVVGGGPRHVVLYSAAPIRDATGKIIGGVGASADITEQKRLQQELDARRREAEEASARKTRFLAAVSHDIRTPANAISLLAELMQRTANTPALQDEVPQLAADLRKNALSLVTLVSDVLDLARFDSGRIDLDESEFMLDSLLSDECRQFQALARDKGLEFTCEPPPTVKIRADRVKLERILGNLVSNAMKFTPSGQITVRAAASRDKGIHIDVHDTGLGIPRELQDRIFDEFFQVKHNTSNNNHNGSGLGLAICRRLAHAMGGTISLESEPGSGSRFRLLLPPTAIVPS